MEFLVIYLAYILKNSSMKSKSNPLLKLIGLKYKMKVIDANVELNNIDYHFTIDYNAYSQLIDKMALAKKGMTNHFANFCLNTVKSEQKTELHTLFEKEPGLDSNLAGELMDQYMTDIEVRVKKSTTRPSESSTISL